MNAGAKYNAYQIADYFLSRVDTQAGDTISPLKLQKMIYYAQAWHYTLFGEPLFDEEFEAWTHGPALWSQWKRFSSNMRTGNINIKNISLDVPKFPENTSQLLDEVNSLYGEHSGSYLEKLTHNEDPWKDARGDLEHYKKCNNPITLESMKKFYSKRLNEQE